MDQIAATEEHKPQTFGRVFGLEFQPMFSVARPGAAAFGLNANHQNDLIQNLNIAMREGGLKP